MTEEVFVFPLSFAQQRLWFLDQLSPGKAFYNSQVNLQFATALNVSMLEQSLNEIVRRHESLRTTFTQVNGEPVQVVAPTLNLELPVVDLRGVPEREAEAARLAAEQDLLPFDLSKRPLLRPLLLRLDEEDYVLSLTMHHIVTDGWSMGILVEELMTLYEAFSQGQPSPLPELPIQYADFAVWQRDWLQGEVLETQLSYWKRQLNDLPVLQLPTDRPRPAIATYRGACQPFALPEELLTALKALSQREGVTLFMVLLAAFKVLLHRYSGQEEIVVGSPIAGRTRVELEGLIGFFVNTLVLRTTLAGDPSFRELLGRVREVTLGAYAHQDLPFEKLVEELQPERSLSRNPMYQVMFQLLNASRDGEGILHPTAQSLEVGRNTAISDLGIDVWESQGELVGQIEYSTDLFDEATIQRLAGHFQTLLEGVVANPEQRLSELPLLTQVERSQLLIEWNKTQTGYARDCCIHQLFEEQAAQTPKAVAVVSEKGQLTYEELNRRANQLAHHLRALGVGADTLVGLCVERSLEMIVGLLGVLKAGGAYVPLDPAYPKERLAFMLEDSQAGVLLTQQRLLEWLPEHQAQVICLDSEWERIAGELETTPTSEVSPDNLAYVIYTSGSTGQPKGVMIEHRSLVNFTEMVRARYGLRPDDRLLQFAAFSFDTAAEEIYPSLTLGATLVLRTESMIDSVATFLEKCRELKLTVLDLPTAYWHQLAWELATRGLELPETIRLIIVGGEKALPERLADWHQSIRGRVLLMHGYGPTEVTVVATVAELTHCGLAEPLSGEVPIGQPLGNVQVYVLDRNRQPVPIGIPGELYIGGNCLARGYLNQPALTDEKFIQHPFSIEPGARLYRTGDLVRYLADGNLEFLGRLDNQIKIRGFRVELGEIEAALGQHPGVRDALVLAREDMPGDKRLVAYLIANEQSVPTQSELRRYLKTKLPEYMVPTAFEWLEALPLTPSGKIDRLNLPQPTALRPESEVTYLAPQTEMERSIATIWQAVLGVEQVGIHDNFFDLGGHSLLVVRVHSQLHDALGAELSMIELFKYPTVSSLAEYLSRASSAPTSFGQAQDRAARQRAAVSRHKQQMMERTKNYG